MSHQYTYDALYRLTGASGTYTGADGKTAGYTLAMGYDNMHRITSKRQTPGEDANVKNSHAYEYDANGNLIYVNTSREKKDGESDEKAGERKLRWDEENRLLSSDDNGFVTN